MCIAWFYRKSQFQLFVEILSNWKKLWNSQIKYFGAVAKEANSSISSQRKTIDAKAADDAAAAAAAPLRGSKK